MSKLQSINPFTNQVIAEFDLLSEKEIEEKIQLGNDAQKQWKESTIQERSSFILNAAEYLNENKYDLAELISNEMGKPIREALMEIEKCSWVCRYFVHHTSEHLEDIVIETEAKKSFIHYEPLGLVLAVMPWNFPFWQVFRFAAPALMAGNGALLKHASNVNQCSLAIEKVFQESGFPKHLFQSLLINSSQVESVLANDKVKAVTLTGSEKAGSSVASIAGREIKKSVLELGGSDPFIVLEDADIEMTISKAIQSRMINSGQSCIAAKRFIVMEGVYEKFKAGILTGIEKYKVSDPLDENTLMGPMARPDLAEELWNQVQASIKLGAIAIKEGKAPEKGSAVFKPIVLENIKPGMPAFEEEFFGPVFILFKVSDLGKAAELANSSPFGLGASIWSQNSEEALKLAKKIDSGAVFINELVKSDPRVPFGGIKKSGYGRELSELGIKEFMNAKTIWIEK